MTVFFALAAAAGDKWMKRVTDSFAKEEEESGVAIGTDLQLLSDIHNVTTRDEESIATVHLLDRLCRMEESQWSGYNFKERDEEKRRIKPKQLAALLKPYKVHPGTIRTGTGDHDTIKGYHCKALEDAYQRYVHVNPPPTTVTPAQANKNNDLDADLSVTTGSAVTDKNGPNSLNNNESDGVTDKMPHPADDEESTPTRRDCRDCAAFSFTERRCSTLAVDVDPEHAPACGGKHFVQRQKWA